MFIDDLPSLIDAALAALSSDGPAVGLTFERAEDCARVSVGSLEFDFGAEPLHDILAWELLVDALPNAVERVRLLAMHDAVGAKWAAPWSVYTTTTALAWLIFASGGAGTPQWRQNVDRILSAADWNASVAITVSGATGPAMNGILRSRRLLGLIQTGPRTHYLVEHGRLLVKDILPDTLAIGSANRHVTRIIDAPWLAGWDVTVADTLVGAAGTVLVLREAMVPLETIPAASAAAAPAGPAYAPWIVTEPERAALDAIDDAAHLDR